MADFPIVRTADFFLSILLNVTNITSVENLMSAEVVGPRMALQHGGTKVS
jgi:hypothetical protein